MESFNETKSLIPSPTIAPKKRGRPANPNKIVKMPSGRGRGRPSKNSLIKDKKIIADENRAEKSREKQDKDKHASVENSSSRGRPPKLGKAKITQKIVPTGKGRGRPRKSIRNDDISKDHRKTVKTGYKSRGRPKKQISDNESSEDKNDAEDIRRPVGRPRTGGLNLKIERTGRGQGRPRKCLGEKHMLIEDIETSYPKKRKHAATVRENSNRSIKEQELDSEVSNNVSPSDGNENNSNSSEKHNED